MAFFEATIQEMECEFSLPANKQKLSTSHNIFQSVEPGRREDFLSLEDDDSNIMII